MKRRRAILFGRVSTHNQIDNTSLDNQIEQCRAFAVQNDFEIVHEIREQASGAYATREGLETAKRLGREGLADCIIVYRMDRFMRGADADTDPGIDAAITERELNRCGLEVIYLDLPDKDSEAYTWVKAIKRIVASVERAAIRDRMETGKRRTLEQGKPAHGGRCPLGYKRNDAGYFEIVESEAEVVRLIFKLFVVDDLNPPSITNYLREHSIPGYRGSIRWGDWIVNDILKREVYIGRYAQIRNVTVPDASLANGHRRVELPKEEWVYVDVPPIIDKNLWERAQDKLLKRRGKSKRQVCAYLLTGRTACECGYAMVGYSTTWKRKDGITGHTRYYCCKATSNRHALKRCQSKMINADKLEAAVWAWVLRVITDREFLEDIHASNMEKIRAAAQPERERLEAIRLERLEIEKRLRRIAQLMLDASDVELVIYKPEAAKLRNSVDYLTGLERNYEQRLRDHEISQDQARELLQSLGELEIAIHAQADNPDFRRKVIDALDLYITVAHDRQTVRVDCAIGEELLDLCTTNASRRQCTDRTRVPRAQPHAPAPGSPVRA